MPYFLVKGNGGYENGKSPERRVIVSVELIKPRRTVMEVRELAVQCAVGPCPAVFESSEGDLIIVGAVLTTEESAAVAHRIQPGTETAVRVPRSLLAQLKL